MHTTNQLLDALASKHENATDYRLSKLLGTSTSAVTNWRKGRTSLSQDFALRVAALLDWQAAYVIACVEKERAEKDSRLEQTGEIVATWEKIAERFRPVVPSILLVAAALFGALNSSPAEAVAHATTTNSELTPYTLYVLGRRARKTLRRWFATIFPAIDVRTVLAGGAARSS